MTPDTPIRLGPDHVAIITPTKGRHAQLRCLLETLSKQKAMPLQIIIADGGRDAASLVDGFRQALPVTWLDCPTPGQIAQRNLALTRLDPDVRVVIYLDDDIQLEPEALERLIALWNAQPREPAGMSLNILNMPQQPDHFVRHMFCMQTEPRGKVLPSGYNTPVTGVVSDIESQWLIGGATAWRRDVLTTVVNRPIASRWAITEDLMFSYAVWKRGEKLMVCAGARVLHVDNTPTETMSAGYFRGNNATLWRYMFVEDNPELSKLAFFWMTFGQTIIRIANGLTGQFWQFGYAAGQIKGAALCLVSLVFRIDIRKFLG